jgi:phosphohistidine phosphatase
MNGNFKNQFIQAKGPLLKKESMAYVTICSQSMCKVDPLKSKKIMDLILWRHADAEIAAEGEDDLSRQLTSKGEKQAIRIATWLDRHLPEGVRILVSPARRTEQTAKALNRRYKLRDELVPDSSADEVLALIKWDIKKGPQGKGPVLLVGHQPYLGEIAARLLAMQVQTCAIRKGAVWWLRSRVREDQSEILLLNVINPDFV